MPKKVKAKDALTANERGKIEAAMGPLRKYFDLLAPVYRTASESERELLRRGNPILEQVVALFER
jgi:hypothetical protein